jgi:predicted hydrocarbon binding protein
LYYPNRFARSLFQVMEAQMGEPSLPNVLSVAQHDQPIYQVYLDHIPPDTLDRAFDFAALAAINQALNVVYGQRAGRGLALSLGRAWFHQGFKNFGALAGMEDPAVMALPPDVRCRLALGALAQIFTHFSDQRSTLEENDQVFRYIVDPCAMAWGLRSERPMCHFIVGLLQACVQWAGGSGIVRETHCRAVEGGACIFAINKYENQQKDIPNG